MKDQAADKRSSVIIGALMLTLALLGVFGWLLSRTDTCPAGWWVWDRLACLEPNALGDTFAGAFAPVAFVWLVAAVMLQRNELAAQRQELRESRAVSTQQVEEARKNVELISVQTKILEDQRKVSIQKDADEDIFELSRIAVKIFNELGKVFTVYDGIPVVNYKEPWEGHTPPSISLYDISTTDPVPAVGEVTNQLLHAHALALELVTNGADIRYSRISKLLPLSNVLAELDTAIVVASPPMRAEVSNAIIGDASSAAVGLYRVLCEHGTDVDEEIVKAVMSP